MHPNATYLRSAALCATLRDRAGTELGRSRLARECADWLELARGAGGDFRPVERVRINRSW